MGTMFISAKASDLSHFQLTDDAGKLVFEHDGYTPYLNGIGGGDYIEIEVDLATGKLIGFDPAKFQEDFKQWKEDEGIGTDEDSELGADDDPADWEANDPRHELLARGLL